MVPWWKRLIYSLVGTLLGAGFCGACIVAQQFLSNPHRHLSAVGLTTAILFFDPWVMVLSLPGWALAIPVVLLVRNIRGWRFWMYWAVGTCLGPAIILAEGLHSAIRGPSFAGFPENSMSLVYLAGAISALTSLIYLVLLRRAQAQAATPATATVA